MAFMELQGVNGRRFVLNENNMRQIMLPDTPDNSHNVLNAANNMLRRVHLHRMFIEPGTGNTFPVAIGLRINNIQGSEFNATGEAYNYILPAEFIVKDRVCIFESKGDESLMATWEQDFGKWTNENLESLCAMALPDSDIVMVHLDHPVTQLIERRPELFGNAAFTPQNNNNTPNWRHLPRVLFEQACNWLRVNILRKSSRTFDFSQLVLNFSRVDNMRFTDLTGNCFGGLNITGSESVAEVNKLKASHANVIVQKPFTITVKLGIQYRITETPVE